MTGCVSVGAPAFAQDFDSLTKPVDTPTLDYFQNNNIQIPQKGAYDKESGSWAEAPAINSPGSFYSITPATEVDYTFSYKLADVEGNLTTSYYKINLDDINFGTSKNVTWEEVSSSSSNTVRVQLPNNVTKYFKYTYTAPENYTTTNVKINNTLDASNANNVVFENCTSGAHVINNSLDKSNIDINADFISNNPGYYNDIINNRGNIGNISGDFIGNTPSYGHTINNSGVIGDITGDFIRNTSSYVVYNYNNSTIGNITGDFISNGNNNYAIVYNYDNSVIGDITGDFIGNNGRYGGAIYNYYNSVIGNITGDFIGNSAANYGGALNNTGVIGNITGDFIGNSVSASNSSGSAIYNKGGVIGDIRGNVIGNIGARAIENLNTDSTTGRIANIYGHFINNSAGGLLNQGIMNTVKGDFIDNTTTYNGGGVNNSGKMTYLNSNFINNKAGLNGGGVNNSGTLTTLEGNFINNNAKVYGAGLYNIGTIDTVKGSFFGNNLTNYAFASGGAIQNGYKKGSGHIGNIEGDFANNYVVSDSSLPEPTFDEGAYYAQGGAIFNINGSTIGKIKGNFTNNYVTSKDYADGGAIHNSLASTIDEIEGSFANNHVIVDDDSDDYSQGGAIQNLAGSKIGKITGDFVGNYTQGALASSGGAIMNSKSAQIDSIKGNFVDNYSRAGETGNYSQGGAIYNSSSAVLKNIEGDFQGNHVYGTNTAGGGAIYNNDAVVEKVKGNFTGNYSSAKTYAAGGAISNYFGTINEIDGSFINNYAKAENGAAKGGAIYSLGTTTLVARDGKTNYISGNYVEDRNGKRNEGIYVATGGYVVKEAEVKKVDGAGFGFYNKYTNYNPDNLQKPIDSAFNIVAENNGTFVINDMINGDSEPGSVNQHITTYYQNYNGTQRVYADMNDNFIVRYEAEAPVVEDKNISLSSGEQATQILTTTNITYKDEAGNIIAKEVNVVSDGTLDSLKYTTSTYYDSEGNEIKELPFKLYDVASSGKIEYNLNFTGDMSGKVYLNNTVRGNANVALTNTNLYLGRDDALNGNNLSLNGGYLSMINNSAGVSALNSMTVTQNTDFVADVDLKNKEMDRFTANAYGDHTGNVNVRGMNLLSDSNQDETVTAVYFAQPGLKNNVTHEGLGELPDGNQTTVYSPIYKYTVTYDKVNQYDGKGDGGYFLFTRGGGGSSGGNPSDSFNPAVLATPVNSVAASQAGMTEAFKYVFEHLDAFTQLPAGERLSRVEANKYALAEQETLYNGTSTDFNSNKGSFNYDESNKAYWLRPYVTFEKMDLKNGPKVDVITYGSLVGYDGDFKPMKHGWHRIGTSYIGYNGSQIKYKGADTTTNGGLLGFTETYYKGNFWSAVTLSAGASVGETRTMYGKEDYATLLAGAASKTGYNFEFKEGKYILQPVMYLSYTFAKTFDYTNAAGVRVETDPAHSLQLHPIIRGVANCKNGWQPYLQVGFVWNALNKSHITADGVRMPEMSMKPYIEYGAGVQRNWDDKYTAFGQAMVRNGGRKGVALTLGFRWAIDRDDDKKKDKVNAPNSNNIAQESGKTVIKQLSPAQKAALCNKKVNTTITANRAVLKQI